MAIRERPSMRIGMCITVYSCKDRRESIRSTEGLLKELCADKCTTMGTLDVCLYCKGEDRLQFKLVKRDHRERSEGEENKITEFEEDVEDYG